jgi:hypothetical protein
MNGTPPLKLKSTITHSPDGMQITIPRSKLVAPIWGSVGLCAGILGVIFFFCEWADPISVLLGYGLGLVLSATGLVTVLYAFSGRTVLILQRDGLVAKKQICRIGWTRFFPADELFDLRCWRITTYQQEGDVTPEEYLTPGIVFVHQGKTRHYGISRLYQDEAEYLVAQIKNCYPQVNVVPPDPRFDKGKQRTSISFLGRTIEL